MKKGGVSVVQESYEEEQSQELYVIDSIDAAFAFIFEYARREEIVSKATQLKEEYETYAKELGGIEGFRFWYNDFKGQVEELAAEVNNGVPVYIAPLISEDIIRGFERAGRMSDEEFQTFMDYTEFGAPRI